MPTFDPTTGEDEREERARAFNRYAVPKASPLAPTLASPSGSPSPRSSPGLPSWHPSLVHLRDVHGVQLCRAAPLAPRTCMHCERDQGAAGDWILCGVLLHRAAPSARCHAPPPSVRTTCPQCVKLERAASDRVDQARARAAAALASAPLLPFARR